MAKKTKKRTKPTVAENAIQVLVGMRRDAIARIDKLIKKNLNSKGMLVFYGNVTPVNTSAVNGCCRLGAVIRTFSQKSGINVRVLQVWSEITLDDLLQIETEVIRTLAAPGEDVDDDSDETAADDGV